MRLLLKTVRECPRDAFCSSAVRTNLFEMPWLQEWAGPQFPWEIKSSPHFLPSRCQCQSSGSLCRETWGTISLRSFSLTFGLPTVCEAWSDHRCSLTLLPRLLPRGQKWPPRGRILPLSKLAQLPWSKLRGRILPLTQPGSQKRPHKLTPSLSRSANYLINQLHAI